MEIDMSLRPAPGYGARLHVLAVDPGPTWMGWAVLQVDHRPGVRCTYLRGGHAPCDRVAFSAVLQNERMEAAHTCDLLVTVETPAGYAFQPGRVPQLLRTAWVAGGMAWLAETMGHRVIVATAQQVRKVLAGKANADDSLVEMTVRGQVFGAPATKNDHVNDALAVGVLGAWVAVGQVVLPEVSGGTGKGKGARKQGRKPHA